MSPLRRIRPALVVNTALATALLAATAVGDSVSAPARPEERDASVADTDIEWPRAAGADGPAASQDFSPRDVPADTVPGAGLPSMSANALLAEAVTPLVANGLTRLSVSVLELDGGWGAGFGEARFDTASIVKVNILAALLLRAQDTGRELTAAERMRAEAMIGRSDNASTDVLWLAIGGAAGLDAANARLGLTDTTGGADGHWGLTQTTSADQIALLWAIHSTDSVLRADSRAYIRTLMSGVVSGQRWGISAAADGDFELKNGWLPRTRTGLWDVNSIGWVTREGREYLVAVVSEGYATQAAGVMAVEAAAEAAVTALRATAADGGRPPGV
jgi:hypothetical protein